MKYDPQKTAERLHGVPLENRAFIYDATIIIEFLNQTFMPVQYFLSKEGEREISSALSFKSSMFKDPKAVYEHRISLGTIYDYYKMFREQMDYTAPIESRYKFSVILKKLNFSKNGWAFDARRVGRAQIVYFAPLMLRVKASKEDREKFPPMHSKIEETPVEVTPADHNDDDIPEEFVAVDQGHPEGDRTVEITGKVTPDGFIEVEGHEVIEPDTNDPSQFPAEGSDMEGY